MSKKEFFLNSSPIDYALSIHIRNLFNTYGEEYVRKSLKELFSIDISDEQSKRIKAYVDFGTGEN